MKQEIHSGSGNIQINGDGNKVVQELKGFRPVQDKTNLIACPDCGNDSVSRSADLCPTCHYSFEKARQAAVAEARNKQQEAVRLIATFAAAVLLLAPIIATKLHKDYFESTVAAAFGVLVCYAGSLGVRVWIKFKIREWRAGRGKNC